MAVEERLQLPSRGMIYPEMGTNEYVTVTPYKAKAYRDFLISGSNDAALSKLIDSCLVGCPIKASDMHASDWSAVMFKIRAMTLGNILQMQATCPFCDEQQSIEWNLSDMNVKYLSPEKYPFVVELPESKDSVSVSIKTPKMIERARDVAIKRSRTLGGNPNPLIDAYTFICNLHKDGIDLIALSQWYDELPIKDAVYLTQVDKIIGDFGPEVERTFECKSCRKNFIVMLRTDESFFLPEVGEFRGARTTTGTLEGGLEVAGNAEQAR